MSVNYAAGLSPCDDLGTCGIDEVFDKPDIVREKVKRLVLWLQQYKGSCVIHAGAGISTAAGIRDFRGKEGVWTELKRQQVYQNPFVKKPKESISVRRTVDGSSCETKPSTEKVNQDDDNNQEFNNNTVKPFDEAVPTFTHMALRSLCDLGYIKFIISQNVDGLFLKSNIRRKFISELHGNFYLDECTKCKARYVRSTPSPTMRLEKSTKKCPRFSKAKEESSDIKPKACTGHLRDTILDWESPIPHNELRLATKESKLCHLHICIGTSLQMRPSKDLVCKNKSKYKLVIINLQPTKYDQKADLVINYYADDVMRELCSRLDVNVPNYNENEDPTKDTNRVGSMWKK